MQYDELFERLREHGQEHVLRFWEELNDTERSNLAAQVRQIDLPALDALVRGDDAPPDWSQLAARARPPRAIRLGSADNEFSPEEAVASGEQALRDGRLGMILVAGGQGTRLGFDHPKGMFPIGPLSGRTLFQILIERLRALANRYAVRIPLYLMTSPATHEETLEFFARQQRFGLAEEDLNIFCQGVMPAVDAETGRLLLAERDSLALSPDGHGGTVAALVNSGCLADASERGIDQLFYGQVDNPLAQLCDPQLIGYHLLAGSDMTTQVVQKRQPTERVGNVVEIDGQTRIIEYSDLPDEFAEQTNADGSLRLWAGNLANHVFRCEFLSTAAEQADALPFHRARKQVPYVDEAGHKIAPTAPNAIKFERFIFDLLPRAAGAIAVEAESSDAFAPVKNADDAAADTPTTARAAMIDRDKRLLSSAGVVVAEGVAVEVSPLWALDADEARQRAPQGLRITEPKYFAPPGE